MSKLADIKKLLQSQILLLDGAMGTMIQRYSLKESDFRGERFQNSPIQLQGNNDLLSINRPDVIKAIHRQYLEAGANIIETNTFNSNRVSQSDYGLQDIAHEIARAGAAIAKETVNTFMAEHPERQCFVAGILGPMNRSASISPDANKPAERAITFDELVNAYKEQAIALLEGGADILMVETVFDTLNAKAALFAVDELLTELNKTDEIPVMLSVTFSDASGRTLSGQTLEAFWNSVCHSNLLSIGMNCALGAHEIYPHLKELSKLARNLFVSCHPNAGLPNAFGEYEETPEEMAKIIEQFATEGLVNIVGGCCGTSPDTIRAMAERIRGKQPRKLSDAETITRLSGLEPLNITKNINLVNIGERTNVAGSAKFCKLIQTESFNEALSIARHQVENGAQIIDINMDAALLDSVHSMKTFLNLIASEPEIARVPVMIDSSNWEVIETGLKCLQGKGIVNSISLKEGEEVFLEHARRIHKYGSAMVVMAFDEKGQATTLERKIEICTRAYKLLTGKANIPPEDIIFDPNILTIGTGIAEHNNYAIWFIEAVRYIKKNLPYAKTSGGISNISFAFRGNNLIREAIHTVFLYHAVKAGLDMAIVNSAQLGVYEQIEPKFRELVEDLVLNRTPNASENLLKYAEEMTISSTHEQKKQDAWRELPAKERLSLSLVKGITDYLDADLKELLGQYNTPLKIIEEPLMDGMKQVGELFGAGKMFLPQVIKSARVMQASVDKLLPFMQDTPETSRNSQNKKKILIATVKGDVHDIGKNIVGIVLKCNHFDVIDLGVMVPCEKIVQAAKKNQVDAIGLSGLITPSLTEMEHVATELQKAGLNVPLIIGGATTSPTHTAVRLAPLYDAPVVHVADASLISGVLENLFNPAKKFDFIQKHRQKQKELCQTFEYNRIKKKFITEEQANANRFVSAKDYVPAKPAWLGVRRYLPSIQELIPLIEWSPFFHTFEIRGRYPDLLEKPAAKELWDDAQKLLVQLQTSKITPKGVLGIFKAACEGNDILIEKANGSPVKIPTMRQLIPQPEGKSNLALADFILPKDNNGDFQDTIAAFAVTSGLEIKDLSESFSENNDPYNSVLTKALGDRLAEAFACYIHQKTKEIYGICEEARSIRTAPGYPSCPDHQQKIPLFDLLDAQINTGIELTESTMMNPVNSVCAWIFTHPQAKYFDVGRRN